MTKFIYLFVSDALNNALNSRVIVVLGENVGKPRKIENNNRKSVLVYNTVLWTLKLRRIEFKTQVCNYVFDRSPIKSKNLENIEKS